MLLTLLCFALDRMAWNGNEMTLLLGPLRVSLSVIIYVIKTFCLKPPRSKPYELVKELNISMTMAMVMMMFSYRLILSAQQHLKFNFIFS